MADTRLRTLTGRAIPTQCDYLVEFVTIAREGSLSKASYVLAESQSSLSRHLKSVEASLGMTLLDRRADGVALTEAGRYVYNRTGDIIDAVEDILLYASEHHDTDIIAIGGMTIFPAILQTLIGKAAASPENVSFKALPAGTFAETEIEDMLGQNRADLYLTMSTDGRIDYLSDEYEVHPAFSTPVVAVMQATNPLASKDGLSLSDLDGQMLLHAQTSFDGERVNWEDTKDMLPRANVDYRAKTCTLEDRSNLLNDLKTGIILLPEAYEGVRMLRDAGRTVLGVGNLTKDFVVISRIGEKAGKLVESFQLGLIR